MLIHGRNGVLAFALTALALIVPSAASAHDLVIYKVEKHLTLTADEGAETVSCNTDDHALDGMWRVDHADQDEYVAPLELIKTAVDVLQAAPTSDSTYSFKFTKNAIGNVQVKMWVTCLKDQTQGGAHSHDFTDALSSFQGPTPVPVTGATPASEQATCTGKQVVVSPGFTVTSIVNANNDPVDVAEPEPGMNRLFESNYTSATMNEWQWTFANVAGVDSNVNVTWRCLSLKVPKGTFDKHKLVFKHATHDPDASLPAKKVSEVRLDCKSAYKAAVAGFTIALADYPHVWYLGMDPRPKQRAFRFVNTDTSPHPVKVRALCINYRTT